ncbi:GNAT family N-acetyltransferase [Fluviispira vulneris]|uniref:GNAT family N-acetyltransferase n=1 Tax=Fluviispira vulneris TaxID=2763012 RepID=UPI001645DFA4|nr:GNAT family N-acetyltransferase [Fluviispira vulneris]
MVVSNIENICTSNILETKIKILNKSEWQTWKKIRLESLKNAPTAFASSFKELSNKPDTFFQEIVEESKIYGAFCNGELVSVATFRQESREKECHRGHISGVYTKPEFAGKGIGSKLIAAVIKDASKFVTQIHLGCVVNNESALRMYKKQGFEIYGTDPRAIKYDDKYYDMHLMWLNFNPDK